MLCFVLCLLVTLGQEDRYSHVAETNTSSVSPDALAPLVLLQALLSDSSGKTTSHQAAAHEETGYL